MVDEVIQNLPESPLMITSSHNVVRQELRADLPRHGEGRIPSPSLPSYTQNWMEADLVHARTDAQYRLQWTGGLRPPEGALPEFRSSWLSRVPPSPPAAEPYRWAV
jgi:hypothetical protein